jgi:thioredoxin-like negative regulator of GroEL
VIELLLEAERAMEMGRIDAAETLYRQVIESDPRNGIAVVGLARVILERGDELGAYQAAQRALAIDPENSAAQRMVTRLAEVLAYRGEPVPEPPASDTPVEAPAPTPTPAPTKPDDGAAPATGERSRLDRFFRKR